jgi:hypothetical protein
LPPFLRATFFLVLRFAADFFLRETFLRAAMADLQCRVNRD